MKLNWNEGLFGPLPGVLEAVERELPRSWSYPEHAFRGLREAVAAETGARADRILPGHGIQALIVTLCSTFLSPGERVVIPHPRTGATNRPRGRRAPTRSACRRPSGGWTSRASRTRRSARGHGSSGSATQDNPTGSVLDAAEWQAFLDALPAGCVVAADEAYVDYMDPGRRIRREDDVAAGRWSCYAPSRRSTAWPGCGSATPWPPPRSCRT